jgi:phosphopantothenoylcysteine decarboxylase/phosphopantothenate--cysteine ligase
MMRANPRSRPLRVVVTAGPTREPIDDVRFLSNASTGRMGVEIAAQARRRGARVTLVLGPSAETVPAGVDVVRVETAREMLAATRSAARGADVVVFAAAPADWRPATRVRGKIKKGTGGPRRPSALRLVENPDIAATLGATKGARVHVGFALEVRDGLANAREKLRRKRFDAIVLNGPANVGRGGGAVRWIGSDGPPRPLPSRPKRATAKAIVERTWALLPRAGR